MSPTLPRAAAAAASGLAMGLISPPVGLHGLHWVSYVPLLLALDSGSTRRSAALAWASGAVAVFTLFSWLAQTMVIFAAIPSPLAWVLTGVFALVFGLPYALVFGLVHPLRRAAGAGWIFIVPALQVAVEHLGPALFPYHLGATQAGPRPIWQIVSVTGVTGASYLVLLSNCALAEAAFCWREGRHPRWIATGLAALTLAGAWGYGAWRLPRIQAAIQELPTLRVAQLQQSTTMAERMQGTSRDAMLSWLKMSSAMAGQPMDLMVWPEGATPYDPRGARVGRMMSNLARGTLRASVLFGGGYAEPRRDKRTGEVVTERRNSMYFMDPAGELVDRYDKMVPLAFGEYIPGARWFPVLKQWIKGPGDFVAGDRAVLFGLDPQDGRPAARLATPICYEAILGPHVREHFGEADLLVNVTNDGWFGDTAAPHQHAILAAARAVELGIPMFRLAYTGVSMTVDPSGEVSDVVPPFVEMSRVVEVPYGRIPTVYARVGELFSWLCAAVSAIALVGIWRRSSVTPTPPPS